MRGGTRWRPKREQLHERRAPHQSGASIGLERTAAERRKRIREAERPLPKHKVGARAAAQGDVSASEGRAFIRPPARCPQITPRPSLWHPLVRANGARPATLTVAVQSFTFSQRTRLNSASEESSPPPQDAANILPSDSEAELPATRKSTGDKMASILRRSERTRRRTHRRAEEERAERPGRRTAHRARRTGLGLLSGPKRTARRGTRRARRTGLGLLATPKRTTRSHRRTSRSERTLSASPRRTHRRSTSHRSRRPSLMTDIERGFGIHRTSRRRRG